MPRDARLGPRQVALPTEVICHFLLFLSPREIVRLGQISKHFRDLVYDPVIWKALYATARLPRPPGPFPSQSVQFLAYNLVHSERLAETWTSQPVKVISRVVIPTKLSYPESYAVTSTMAPFGLYGMEVPSSLTSVPALSHLSTGYDFTSCCAAHRTTGKLLEFEVDDRTYTLSEPVSVDIPFLPREVPFAIYGRWPFLCIRGHGRTLVWDMRTRIFHALPPFSTALTKGDDGPYSKDLSLILSKTDIISRTVYYNPTIMIFQAFVVADLPGLHSAGDGIPELCLTHEASIHHFSSPMGLIRNSILDPDTRATNLRLLNYFPSARQTAFSCIDLTLPEPSPGKVLPMGIRVQHLFTTDGYAHNFIGKSEDGHVRGFSCLLGLGDSPILKYSIDASRETCVAAVGDPCRVAGIDSNNVRLESREFDAIRGRICYTKAAKDYLDVVVVDIE
ncbi:hypothetical protein BU15DRAFT_75210 [Melanogaster broomeanus]|nr:hypothetical protein BU15DRAFT_75210 [Melanogaster broomeanus]